MFSFSNKKYVNSFLDTSKCLNNDIDACFIFLVFTNSVFHGNFSHGLLTLKNCIFKSS